MIYFCSGYKDLTDEEFQKYYIPQITKIQNTNSKYIISDSNNFDFQCIRYLLSQNVHPENIIIYSINTLMSQNIFMLPESKSFKFVGGFFDQKECDIYSTENSNEDILWIREIQDIPYYDKNYTSRTYLNYLRRLKKKTLDMYKSK